LSAHALWGSDFVRTFFPSLRVFHPYLVLATPPGVPITRIFPSFPDPSLSFTLFFFPSFSYPSPFFGPSASPSGFQCTCHKRANCRLISATRDFPARLSSRLMFNVVGPFFILVDPFPTFPLSAKFWRSPLALSLACTPPPHVQFRFKAEMLVRLYGPFGERRFLFPTYPFSVSLNPFSCTCLFFTLWPRSTPFPPLSLLGDVISFYRPALAPRHRRPARVLLRLRGRSM